jgi:hypothetical protein
MSVRTVTALAVLALSAGTLSLALGGCHDGAGKRTETTQVRITGTPKAGYVAPSGQQAPAGDFQTNVDLVKSLYALDAIPTEPAEIGKYFAAEFVTPMAPTANGVTVDFDYRINGQDGAADNLTITEDSGDGANGMVVSKFTNMGHPEEVHWTVCRQPDGTLRLMDVKSATGDAAWDMREIVGLPARAEGC